MCDGRHRARGSALACLTLLAASVLGGCGGKRALTVGAAVPVAAVVERDFHITAPAHLPPGTVQLHVSNEGPDEHELIIVPRGGAGLPLRHDGLTVDEEALAASEPGSLAPGEPGARRTLSVELKPGRYLFFCNMEGHFLGGMQAEVVVG